MPDIDPKSLTKFSYSKISCYGSCHMKYKLHYEDKNYLFSESIATSVGTLVHETEEAIATALKAGRPINYIALKNNFIIGCRKLAHKYPEDWNKLDKSGRTYAEKMYLYLDSAIYRLEKFMLDNPDLEIIGIEQKFEYDYDGVHAFTGSIDRAFRNKTTGEILIQDIKTWPMPAQSSELKSPAQFTVYAMAAQQLWNIEADKIKCEYDLPFCDFRQSAISDNIIADGKPQLDKWFAGIAKRDFKPSTSPLCYFCQYCPNSPSYAGDGKVLCPYHSLWTRENSTHETAIKWMGLEFHDMAVKQYKDLFLCPNVQT